MAPRPDPSVPPAAASSSPAATPDVPEADEATPRGRPWALGAVLAAPILANLVAIVGLVKYQPQAKTSGLGLIHQLGILNGGQPYIDPNVGFNSYAVGHAAAMLWLHGHVPWWDFNQGVGTPLAGSIQSGAFFPPTLLLALTDGSLWFHLFLELFAGWALYALLRQLRCGAFPAAAAAIAFELNGSLAWITNAPANPVPLLPVMCLGIEWVIAASGARRRGGWVLLALGVWLTIVAGFPEVAVLNAALAGLWLVVRAIQHRRDLLQIVARAATAVVTGGLLAAPLLNAFVRNLRLDVLGQHHLDLAKLSIPRTGLAQLVAPYVFGGIYDNATTQVLEVWGRVGGYTGVALLALAIGGFVGRRERWIRWLVGGWALLFLGYTYDVPVLHAIVVHIPGLLHLAVYRYAISSVLFCMCVLAAFCLDDLRTATARQAMARVLPGIAFVVVVFAIGFFSTTTGRQWSRHYLPKWYWGSIAIFCVTVAVLLVAVVALPVLRGGRWRRVLPVVLGVVLAGESFGFFEVPILAYPRSVTYDTAVVAYLRAHLGTQRYYTIGPASPDFGAFYGIASLDLSDLPEPQKWANYVQDRLNPCVFPWQFGNGPPLPGCVPAVYEMLAHVQSYEQSAVKYFVIGSAHDLSVFFQPNTSGGPPTPDGAARMVLELRAPSFFPTGRVSGFDVRIVDGIPKRLVTTACSAGQCEPAAPTTTSAYGWHFALATPLTVSGSLTITLAASNAAPVRILTVPSAPPYPSTVTADHVVLDDRSAMLHFEYVASSVPHQVFRSRGARVYALPDPAALASAPACRVHVRTVTTFTASCTRASTLTYRELSFPGWHATVKGRATAIATAANGIFQEVRLPKGNSTIRFSYEPPMALVAWIAMALGLLVLVGEAVRRRLPGHMTWPRRAPVAAAGDPEAGAPPDPGRPATP